MDLGRVGIWTFALDLQPVARAREVGAELEELGYGAIWIPDAVGRDPLVHAALLLGGTNRIAVGTGIAQIYGRDPMTMTGGWKTITEAFPGRFVLGLGVSHQPMVEGLRGQTYGPPLTAMREYLERMDTAMYVAAEPTESPRRVLAALGPKMLALAAERADGAHPYNVPPEHTARAREILGPDKLLAPEQAVLLETDPVEARRIARGHMAIYLDLPNYMNNLRRFGITDDDIADGGSDHLVDTLVAWGDVDAVRARVKSHLDAGADHVAVQVLTPDRGTLPLDDWRELAPVLL
ncbi:MAG TPA: LLM class F420-dependent oxidoreductase [Acidimicrobiia bacterium]|nr:LLM class F420-dependent oxidoreductase [Acidimicrobiia bacterium]